MFYHLLQPGHALEPGKSWENRDPHVPHVPLWVYLLLTKPSLLLKLILLSRVKGTCLGKWCGERYNVHVCLDMKCRAALAPAVQG